MHTIGLFHTSDLSRFFTRQIIDELELTEEPARWFLAGIDEDDDNVSPGQHKYTAPTFIPSCFNSKVFIKKDDVARMLRPLTHELVSVDDEIIYPTTGRAKNISSLAPARPNSSSMYHGNKQSHLSSPPSSYSSSSEGEEEKQINPSDTKLPKFSSNLDGRSSDTKFYVSSQHTAVTPSVSRLWSKWKA